jgi:hypothetical protein
MLLGAFVIRQPDNPARAGLNKDILYKPYSKAQLVTSSGNRSSINNRTIKDALMEAAIA